MPATSQPVGAHKNDFYRVGSFVPIVSRFNHPCISRPIFEKDLEKSRCEILYKGEENIYLQTVRESKDALTYLDAFLKLKPFKWLHWAAAQRFG